MLFNTPRYVVFLVAVLAVYWSLPSRHRNLLLLIASYVFYMSWKPSYGILIFALAIVNYLLGLFITRASTYRMQLLVLAVATNLGTLAFFKYTNFVLESATEFLRACGLSELHSPVLDVILPLGISFFIFEFIHYVVDIYRGNMPIHNFTNFHLFASFFPTQIAGPIKRFEFFNAQLKPQPPFEWKLFHEGVELILVGMFKKVVLADRLAPFVAAGFDQGNDLGTADAWLAVYAFALQIFFDFSGYTDIGRGSAQLLGYRVPINFNIPYVATSVADFWHRWHISLSTWLRDYLFIPLGGSRVGSWRLRRNLMVTMALGGLWHGAAWHYVVWGFYHGMALVIYRELNQWGQLARFVERIDRRVWMVASCLLTFHAVCIGWVFFRAADLNVAFHLLSTMFSWSRGSDLMVRTSAASWIAGAGICYAGALSVRRFWPLIEGVGDFGSRVWLARMVFYAGLLASMILFAPRAAQPFLYFQF